MKSASKIFLSIRQGEYTSNGFKVKAGEKRPDRDDNLYYKIIQEEKSDEKEIDGLNRMVEYRPDAFLSLVKESIKDQESKDILFFIHGYHPFEKVLHTDLLDKLVEFYSHDESKKGFGAIVFFSWPNTGLQWREDDEAYVIGQTLANKYDGIFKGLKRICDNKGSHLYLMCQSFGHYVLNGMVKSLKTNTPYFEKAFLMAADIPNESLNSSPQVGIHVRNKIGDKKAEYTHYNLTPLRFLSKEIHVFYDLYDIILTSSKINFLREYERLGKTGPQGGKVDTKFIVHDYNIYKDDMYLGAKIDTKGVLKILIKITGKSQKQYNKRHQYFYSNKKIREIINKEIL